MIAFIVCSSKATKMTHQSFVINEHVAYKATQKTKPEL